MHVHFIGPCLPYIICTHVEVSSTSSQISRPGILVAVTHIGITNTIRHKNTLVGCYVVHSKFVVSGYVVLTTNILGPNL